MCAVKPASTGGTGTADAAWAACVTVSWFTMVAAAALRMSPAWGTTLGKVEKRRLSSQRAVAQCPQFHKAPLSLYESTAGSRKLSFGCSLLTYCSCVLPRAVMAGYALRRLQQGVLHIQNLCSFYFSYMQMLPYAWKNKLEHQSSARESFVRKVSTGAEKGLARLSPCSS